MTYSSVYKPLLIRSVLLILNALLIAYVGVVLNYFITLCLLGVIFILQSWELTNFITSLSKKLSKLFSSIQYRDFTLQFADDLGGPHASSLSLEINQLIRSFREVKLEKERRFVYLEQVVNMLPTGVLSFTADQNIQLFNTEAQRLLGCPRFARWDVFSNHFNELANQIAQMETGGKRLCHVNLQGQQALLSVTKEVMVIDKEEHTILNFQNIYDQIEKKELEAYERLIRVLTHEILNAVSPMISISETLLDLGEGTNEIKGDDKSDLLRGLRVLHLRSRSIRSFIENYRRLIAFPSPQLERIDLASTLQAAMALFELELEGKSIEIITEIEDSVFVLGDDGQLQQVVINLLLNGMQAVKEQGNPRIVVRLRRENGRALFTIIDNGYGIPSAKLSKVFVPFYSTTEGGSGIGLSLCRNIISAHQGQIRLRSKPGETQFDVYLPLS